jgi:antitoxin component YwqK of YwqJK toxin-antitoxin module
MENEDNALDSQHKYEQKSQKLSHKFSPSAAFDKYKQTRDQYNAAKENYENIKDQYAQVKETVKKTKSSFKEAAQQVRQLSETLQLPVDLKEVSNKALKEELTDKIDWIKESSQEITTNKAEKITREFMHQSDLEFAEVDGTNIEDYEKYTLNLSDLNEDSLKDMLSDRLASLEMYAENLEDETEDMIDDANDQLEDQQDAAEDIEFHKEMKATADEVMEDSDMKPKIDPKAPLQEVKTIISENKEININISKGLKHGPMIIKGHGDHPEMEMEFAMDKLHGTSKYYFPNGKLERQIEFKEGKMHGAMQVFQEDGKPSMEIYYENGQMHGPSTMYNEHGEIHITSNYANGKLEGEMVIYSDGKPYLKRIYKNGLEIHQEFDQKAITHMH